MGVTWGIEEGNSAFDPIETYVQKWSAFCAAGICEEFVVPIDDDLFEFLRLPDGDVRISTFRDPEYVEERASLSFGDGTYDDFELVTDGYELYVPDRRGTRVVDDPLLVSHRTRVSDLRPLSRLSWKQGVLARDLRAAARVCAKFRMMIGVSY